MATDVAADHYYVDGRKGTGLLMVDVGSKLVMSPWVEDKKPQTTVDAIVSQWNFPANGAPIGMLLDSDPAFHNPTIYGFCKRFSIRVYAIAPEAHWANPAEHTCCEGAAVAFPSGTRPRTPVPGPSTRCRAGASGTHSGGARAPRCQQDEQIPNCDLAVPIQIMGGADGVERTQQGGQIGRVHLTIACDVVADIIA